MTALEDRLSAALHARVDRIGPEDLTPATPPAVVVPIWRERKVVYAVAGLAAAAAIAASLVIAGQHGGGVDKGTGPATQGASPSPTASPTSPSVSPSVTPTGPAATAVRRQVPVVQSAEESGDLSLRITQFHDGGADTLTYRHSTTLPSGTKLSLAGPPAVAGEVQDGQARLVITSDGVSRDFVFPAGPVPEVDTTQVVFNGEGPIGYLVDRPAGGDFGADTLILDQGTELMGLETASGDSAYALASAENGDSGYFTFVATDGVIYTAYSVPGQTAGQVTVVRWGITGPAAGPQLTTTSLGTACVNDPMDIQTYTRC